MVDIQRILCPIDFSDESRHAFEHAVAFATWYDAQITALHVYGMPMPIFPVAGAAGVAAAVPLPPADAPDVVADELRRFCEPLMPSGQKPEVVVREGSAAREIVACSETIAADLLIMGTHGRGGFDRLFLGSVTEKVLRSARSPVLTVPPRAPHTGTAPALYATIVCPLDFSDASVRALEYALSLAQEADARLILVHVVEGVIEQSLPGEVAHFTVSEYHRFLEADAMRRLDAALPVDARTWCKPEKRVVSGKAYREVLRLADETAASLIVMGVHGRGALNRMLFGSTTHHVIRAAACPVLTLRA